VDWEFFCALCSSALNTQLVDNTFPEDDFEVVLGSLEVKWQRIGPYLLCLCIRCYFTFSSEVQDCCMKHNYILTTVTYDISNWIDFASAGITSGSSTKFLNLHVYFES